MPLKTSNSLHLCVLTAKSAKSLIRKKKCSLQCTGKLDLQCSEAKSKISANIIIIQIIEQGFLPKSDLFQEMYTFCKRGFFFFFLRSRSIFLKKPALRNKQYVQHPHNIIPMPKTETYNTDVDIEILSLIQAILRYYSP